MPYKNQSDKNANARQKREIKRGEVQCKYSGCLKIIPASRSKFCDDKCREHYFAEQAKNERLKIKKQQEPRYCKNEKCGKQLPFNISTQKKYCKGTDCYTKQNAIDMQRRRIAERTKRRPAFKPCEFEGCDKEFEVSGKKTRQKYCSDECTLKAKREREKNRKRENASLAEENKVRKEDAQRETDLRRKDNEKVSGINPRFLERRLSKGSSNQISTAIDTYA